MTISVGHLSQLNCCPKEKMCHHLDASTADSLQHSVIQVLETFSCPWHIADMETEEKPDSQEDIAPKMHKISDNAKSVLADLQAGVCVCVCVGARVCVDGAQCHNFS